MKRNLLMAGLILLTVASCKKEAPEGDQGNASSDLQTATIELTDTQNWKEDAALGVFTADDFNVKFSIIEGAGTTTAKFKGQITKETTPLAAYIPYSAEAGDDMTKIPVNIPTAVVQGEGLELYRFQASSSDFKFYEKLATLKLTFSNVEGSLYEGKSISAVTVNSARKITGVFTANCTQPQTTAIAETYESSNSVEMAFPSGTVLSSDVVGYAAIAPYIKAGTKLTISAIIDGKVVSGEVSASQPTAEGEEYELVIDAGLFEPKMELVWAYGTKSGDQELMRPQGNVPAIDDAGNVYVMTNGYNGVLKINSNGTKAWAVDAAFNGVCQFNPSIESDGSVVYIGGGKDNQPFVRAIAAADGATKWTFTADKFFNNGSTPAPNLQRRITPAITNNAVIIGNGGSTGTVLSIDKATGERLAYVASADGTSGPGGGCNVGVGITKKGYATWNASWGAYSAKVGEFENPIKTHDTNGKYLNWAAAYKVNGVIYGVDVPDAIACLTVDGVDQFAYMIYKDPDLYVVCSSAEGASTSPSAVAPKVAYKFAGAKKQDQGGMVVGPQNEIIASLKHNTKVPGGVYAINPSTGQLAWKYVLNADVGGATAVDNNGYVHVMSDDGWYHIIQPNYSEGSVKVIYKENMVNILKQNSAYSDAPKVGSWSSPMIGKNGKIYAYIPVYGPDGSNDSRYGVVMCMQYAPCTAPGNTAWPMKGADARHSGNQK